ncbi:kinase-like protein [Xylaria castorea]|nr:kinase-like protein [Xylaria castorea]
MAGRQMRMQQLVSFANEIKTRFESSNYWEYEKFLGNGAFGVTILLREMGRLVVRRKRIAIKLARRNTTGTQQLINEIKFLKRLRGAKHIIKMVASCDDLRSFSTVEARRREEESPGALRRVVDVFGKLVRLPPSAAFSPLEGVLEGPAVALEYLDKGDLVTLKIDIDNDQVHVPNRVLWSLFLCLIRACIGMAYPLERPENTRSVLETVPTDGTKPCGILHQDVAPRNIMIGSGDGLDEHHVGNLFKLIDFGCAREYDPPRGPPENLFDCARIMFQMLDYEPIASLAVVWKNGSTRAGNILPPEDDLDDDPFPMVDLDLRDLIARCLYADARKRPTLQEALDEAQKAVARDPDTFPEPDEETDDSILEFFQVYIHDAPDCFRV